MRRRDALIAVGAVAGAITLPRLIRRLVPPTSNRRPIPGLPGFEWLEGAAPTGQSGAFAGLDGVNSPRLSNPCRAFYGADGWAAGLPIVVFSDFYCPYCRELSRELIAFSESRDDIRLIWREYPIFGARSDQAARAALAAGMQGAYLAAHEYLMMRPLTPQMPDDLGLDAAQFAHDMASAQITKTLADHRGQARALGVIGTPATLIGRVLVQGRLDPALLSALIDEQKATPPPC